MYSNLCAWALPGGLAMEDEDALKGILRLAKSSGYEGVEICMETVAAIVRQKSIEYVRDLFSEKRLIPSGWELPGIFWEDNCALSWRGDETRYQRLLEELPFFARVGRELGCARVYTWPLSWSEEMDYEENLRFHVRRLRPVASVLGYYGCRLGLEWMAPKTCRIGRRYEFVHTMEGALALAEAIGSDHVGLLLDSWHWHISRNTPEDIGRLSAEQVVYVHLNDAPEGLSLDEYEDLKRAVPGQTGVIDLVGFLKALGQIGYDGPVEPCAPGAKALEGKPVQEAAQTNRDALAGLFKRAGVV